MKLLAKIVGAGTFGSAALFAATPSYAASTTDGQQPASSSAATETVVTETVVVDETLSETRKTTIELTPYVWASAFGGTIQPGVGAPRVKVDVGLGDLVKMLKHVDAAFFVSGLVEHNRFVVSADVTHAYVAEHTDFPTGNPLLPTVDARIKLSQTSATGLIGYRVVKNDHAAVDLMAGVRGWWMRPEVSVAVLSVTRKSKVSFADPVVAVRARINASPKWSFLAYGDLGGLGADSKFTAQALATANYRVARTVWLSAGYRYQHVNYDKNGVTAKMSLYGPLFGATFIS